jgi:hypothetical protein
VHTFTNVVLHLYRKLSYSVVLIQIAHCAYKFGTCGIVNHSLDCHGAGHSTLKIMLIDQSHTCVLKNVKIFGLELLLLTKQIEGHEQL